MTTRPHRRASPAVLVAVATISASLALVAWSRPGATNGAEAFPLVLLAMIAIFGLARVFFSEKSVDAKELRR